MASRYVPRLSVILQGARPQGPILFQSRGVHRNHARAPSHHQGKPQRPNFGAQACPATGWGLFADTVAQNFKLPNMGEE